MAKKIFVILAAGSCSLALLGLLGKIGQAQTSALCRDSWRQVIALCAAGFAVSWLVLVGAMIVHAWTSRVASDRYSKGSRLQ